MPLERARRLVGGEVGGDDVADVGEVAGLEAVAVDDRPPAVAHRFGEHRDHAAIGARRVLTRAENVEVAEADTVEAHRLGIDADVEFARELAGGVGAQGAREDRLVLGQLLGLAVGAA